MGTGLGGPGSTMTPMLHPLTQTHDLLFGSSASNYRRYTVWRRQPMSFMSTHERILVIDGEYLHIMPPEASNTTTTTNTTTGFAGGAGLGTGTGTLTTTTSNGTNNNNNNNISTNQNNHAKTSATTLFDSTAKTIAIHFGSIIGCKSSRKHPSHFRVVIYKARESKRYDFEAQGAQEAAEIVQEIKKAAEPFQGVTIRL